MRSAWNSGAMPDVAELVKCWWWAYTIMGKYHKAQGVETPELIARWQQTLSKSKVTTSKIRNFLTDIPDVNPLPMVIFCQLESHPRVIRNIAFYMWGCLVIL